MALSRKHIILAGGVGLLALLVGRVGILSLLSWGVTFLAFLWGVGLALYHYYSHSGEYTVPAPPKPGLRKSIIPEKRQVSRL